MYWVLTEPISIMGTKNSHFHNPRSGNCDYSKPWKPMYQSSNNSQNLIPCIEAEDELLTLPKASPGDYKLHKEALFSKPSVAQSQSHKPQNPKDLIACHSPPPPGSLARVATWLPSCLHGVDCRPVRITGENKRPPQNHIVLIVTKWGATGCQQHRSLHSGFQRVCVVVEEYVLFKLLIY